MAAINRREFLDRSKKTGLSVVAGVTILGNAQSVRAAPENEKISLAMIGVRGRGNSLAQGFISRGDCQITYVCDVDRKTGESRTKEFAGRQGGKMPKFEQDFRKMLEDKSVDAVVIATPDHWHAPATVWSCQAGKDVYVEKPPTQSCWEGQQMIKAARKYKRIVQVGTQNRSAPYNMAARKFIEDGKLGKIHLCRIFNMKNWGNVPMAADSNPPEGLDWDMWNGPAPEHKYNRTLHRYWNHLWRYSGGDICNDGIHQIDLARWLIGVEIPKAVYSTGGRFASTGAAETPDTQIVSYDFDDMIVTFELTLYTPYMLKTDGGIRQSDMIPYWPQNATRIEIYGDKGVMCVGRHGGGWEVYIRPKSRKPVCSVRTPGRFPDPDHKENFVECMRSRKLPNADVEKGHRSALLAHYGNISYRLGGQKLKINRKTEQIVDNPDAMALFKRTYRKPWVIEEEV